MLLGSNNSIIKDIKMNNKLNLAYEKLNEFHGNQLRKDGSKFTDHLFDVYNILKENNIYNEEILISALLHDIIEDTSYSKADLLNDFGQNVYDYVLECTDNKLIPKFERKLLQIAKVNFLKDESRLIKIADKMSNLKSILYTPPTNWNEFRLFGYISWTNEFINNIDIRNELENNLIKQYRKIYKETIQYYSYNQDLECSIYYNYIKYLKENFK